MPSASIDQVIYAKLDAATAAPVSSELRRAGDPTPAAVYEISSCVWDLDIGGTYVGSGMLTLRIDCVADTALSAWTLAISIRNGMALKWTDGEFQTVCNSIEFAQSRATPDDGQADAERIVTITATFNFRENI